MSEFQTNVNTLDLEALKALLPPMKQDGFVVRGADATLEREMGMLPETQHRLHAKLPIRDI